MSESKDKRISEISEQDFWSSLRVPRGAAAGGVLGEAIQLGLAGHKARAYRKLAEFHREERALSWQMALEDAARAKRPTRAQVRKLIRKPLCALGGPGAAGPGTSGKGPQREHEVADLQILTGNVQPVLNHAIHTGDEQPRAFLEQVLLSCYRCREPLARNGGYPLNTMLPAHSQFHFFWRTYLALVHTGPVSPRAAESALKLILGIGRAMERATRRYIVHSRSCFMQGSGVAVMRNGAGRDATFANVSLGDYAGWHSHLDLLSMNVWSLGEVLLEEVPRFGPYEHPMDVLWRAPEAHNQLVVDTFLYDSRPCVGQDVVWHSDEHVDFFTGYHTAYRQVPPQRHRDYKHSADLIVRRTIIFVKEPGYVLVMDSVRDERTGGFNRATSLYWHSPRALRVLGPGLARTGG